ncbi:MAG: GMC family oxidoreductase [Parachlamydia sp.]|nr:GMC family oxidoreductase [Parachlamydia sp.]
MNTKFFSIVTIAYMLSIVTAFADHHKDKKENWDYIVVGNGTAGALLARKLSDPTSHCKYENKVLVLEAGYNYDHDAVALDPNAVPPSANSVALSNPPYAFKFSYTVYSPSVPPVTSLTSAAKGWGGGSMHNYMIAVRGTPQMYDNWASLSGNKRWKYKNLLSTLKAIESYYPHPATPYPPYSTTVPAENYSIANYKQRGDSGLIDIIQLSQPIAPITFYNDIGTLPGVGVGLPVDYNDPSESTVGISAPQRFNTPDPVRTRSFSSRSYIDPIVDLNGDGLNGRKLKIKSGAFVSRVLFRNKTAIGVEYFLETDPNKLYRVYGEKIILSAGTFHTPGILERSGIGDPAILEPLGISVLVVNPNVGANLQDQYGSTASMTAMGGGTIDIPPATGFTDLRGQDGYTADGIRRLQMNISSAGTSPNIQYNFSGLMMNPKSRGSVHIVSTDPTVAPSIILNAYADGPTSTFETDANVIVNYYKYIKQYADALGLTMIRPTPAQFIAGDAALLAVAQSTYGFQAHHVGTTRMATSIADGVVNGNLQVFGVKNLMIADIGIEPQVTDGNTAFGAFVIGMQAAAILGVPVSPQ